MYKHLVDAFRHRRLKRRRDDSEPLPPSKLAAIMTGPLRPVGMEVIATGIAAGIQMYHRHQRFQLRAMHPHDLRRLALARINSLHAAVSEDAVRDSCKNRSLEPLPPEIPAESAVARVYRRPRTFFKLTRLRPSEFLHLYQRLANGICSGRNQTVYDAQLSREHVHHVVHPIDQLLIWMLIADGNNATVIALSFNDIDCRTVERYADHITSVITHVFADEVYWPDAEERKQSYGHFSIDEKAVALLDGTHCRIRVPYHDESSYFSAYKNYHTQNYLIAVNAFGFILYVSKPFKGRGNDRGALNTTEFSRDDCKYVSPGEVIVVDGGFPGTGPLLQPFTKPQIKNVRNRLLQAKMIMQNHELSLDRSKVEHFIHVLKNRAQSLAQRYSRARERQGRLVQAAARIVNRILLLRICDKSGVDVSDL